MASAGYNDIVKDATSSIGYQDNSGNSWNHTIGSGKERLLAVAIPSRGNNPVSVTFNGVALTRAFTSTIYDGLRVNMYYLQNPEVGTHAIQVTFGGGTRWIAGAISAFNVESRPSEIPYYRTGQDYANRSYSRITINNTIAGCLSIDGVFNTDESSSIYVGASQTLIVKGDDTDAGGVAYALNMPLGNTNLDWTSFESSSTALSAGAVVFLPSLRRTSLLGIFTSLMS